MHGIPSVCPITGQVCKPDHRLTRHHMYDLAAGSSDSAQQTAAASCSTDAINNFTTGMLCIWCSTNVTIMIIIHTCRQARCGYIGYCLFFVCVRVFVWLRISPPRKILHSFSSVSWAGNLQLWGSLLPQKPKTGRIGQRTNKGCLRYWWNIYALLGNCDSHAHQVHMAC